MTDTATTLSDALRHALGDRCVSTGDVVERYTVDGLHPAAVVRPPDTDGVAAVLRLASAHGVAVTPFGGGTAIGLGNAPRRLDIVLDTTALDALVEHRPQDLTVTVGAGMTIARLQERLAAHGQMLALDPPLPERATVGGVLAANSSGPRRQRYGTARDLVIGSRALLADGSSVRAGGRVVKNVAGYDLNKLWIGSAGTLAVIVEVTLKVTPIPAARIMLLGAFTDAEAAHGVAIGIARGVIQPLSLELIGPPAARRLAAHTHAQQSEGTWLLAVELGGSAAAVKRAAREVTASLTGAGSSEVTLLEPHEHESASRRLRDFGQSTEDPASAIIRASVLPTDTPIALRALSEAGADAVVGRPGCGLVLGHWHADPGAGFSAAVQTVRTKLAGVGGQVVVQHASPTAKAGIDVWSLDGPDRLLMERLKQTYDPADTLSPGRLLRSIDHATT